MPGPVLAPPPASALEQLCAQLAERRRALGYTQVKVANLSRLRQEEVSRLELGKLTGLTVVKLLRVAQVLGLELVLQPELAGRPTLETVLAERRAAQGPR